MADGDYERRTARDAELKRLERILREMRPARKLTDEKQDKRKNEISMTASNDFVLPVKG